MSANLRFIVPALILGVVGLLLFVNSNNKEPVQITTDTGEVVETTKGISDIVNRLGLEECLIKDDNTFSSIKVANDCVYESDLYESNFDETDFYVYKIEGDLTDHSRTSQTDRGSILAIKEAFADLYVRGVLMMALFV